MSYAPVFSRKCIQCGLTPAPSRASKNTPTSAAGAHSHQRYPRPGNQQMLSSPTPDPNEPILASTLPPVVVANIHTPVSVHVECWMR